MNHHHKPEHSPSKPQTQEFQFNYFNLLPDEILLKIFNNLTDLKTLYFCSLVSQRFALIIPHVHHISLIIPRQNPNSSYPNSTENFPIKLLGFLINGMVRKSFKFVKQLVSNRPIPRSISSFYGDSFRSAVSCLSKFKDIRGLDMELPSPCDQNMDRDFVFKWGAIFGTKIDTFVFVSFRSISRKENLTIGENYGYGGMGKGTVHLAFQCLKEAIVRQRMMLFFIEQHPLLEKVCVTDSGKHGMLSLRNEKLDGVRRGIGFSIDTIGPELKSIEVPVSAMQWFVPVLELPVSGYTVRGATLILMGMGSGDGSRRGGGGFGGDVEILKGLELGEDTFGESVKEIMLNHRSEMNILL